MKLLESFLNKKVNIQFLKDNLPNYLGNVTLIEVGSNFFKIESNINKINKIYSISSITSIEEHNENKHTSDSTDF